MNNKQNEFLNRVSNQTNVSKEDILSLASLFQNKNLNEDENLRLLIQQVSLLANKPIDRQKEDEIIKMVKNENFGQKYM